MKIIAVGDNVFVNSLRLSGIEGYVIEEEKEAQEMLIQLSKSEEVGLILVDDRLASRLESFLTELRKSRPLPLIFSLPRPGGTLRTKDYREFIKKILGV
jgi:V/A-type H+-transporting ATPase subunit F